jgi:hypothetical protein
MTWIALFLLSASRRFSPRRLRIWDDGKTTALAMAGIMVIMLILGMWGPTIDCLLHCR